MKKSIFGSAAAAAVFALCIATASAQSPRRRRNRAHPGSTIRDPRRHRRTAYRRDADQPPGTAFGRCSRPLRPDAPPAAAIRTAITARLGDAIREGLPQKLSESLAARLGNEVQMPRGAALAPSSEPRSAPPSPRSLARRCRRPGGSACRRRRRPASLSPEQRKAVLGAVGRGSPTMKTIGNRLAEEIWATSFRTRRSVPAASEPALRLDQGLITVAARRIP